MDAGDLREFEADEFCPPHCPFLGVTSYDQGDLYDCHGAFPERCLKVRPVRNVQREIEEFVCSLGYRTISFTLTQGDDDVVIYELRFRK